MADFLFDRIAIIGLGLMGGSLARAAKQKQIVKTVVGYNRSFDSCKKALELGIIDEAAETPEQSVKDADIIVICTPLGTYSAIAKQIADHLKPDAILTDVGSVKAYTIEAVAPYIDQSIFVPGHPIAGSEKTGVDAGYAELYESKKVILTPTKTNRQNDINKVKTLWEKCGSHIEMMDAKKHDSIYATVSHLPHLLAFCYLGAIQPPKNDNLEFQRFIRIANSSIAMWRDITLYNSKAIISALNQFTVEVRGAQKELCNKALSEKLKEKNQERATIKPSSINAINTPDMNAVDTGLLPKIFAYALMSLPYDVEYIGTGFRDFTSPLLYMPEGIEQALEEQKESLVTRINDLIQNIEEFSDIVKQGDIQAIESALEARQKRLNTPLK